jgi:superfamily II DNA or RNA helicase
MAPTGGSPARAELLAKDARTRTPAIDLARQPDPWTEKPETFRWAPAEIGAHPVGGEDDERLWLKAPSGSARTVAHATMCAVTVDLDFQLFPWQRDAVERWIDGDRHGPFRGTLEIFTGGGKTLIALACWAEASRLRPDTRLAVVVPTEALARQWRDAVAQHTNVAPEEIGLLGAGERDDFTDRRVLISVINTAAKRLPELARSAQPLMLVVDECHRAGAPTFQRVLHTPADFRLGLSATPDREEIDEEGEPIEYDEHVLGQKLGEVVSRFSLGDARDAGWLPEYVIHHHGVRLLTQERADYDGLSRRIDDLGQELSALGGDTTRARAHAGRPDRLGQVARQYVSLTARRKDVLYRASERHRVAVRLVRAALRTKAEPHILLFHERVAEAEELYLELKQDLGDAVGLEHSRVPDARRSATLQAFRDGRVTVLVSVKSLIEGIDVPAADVGISVASSSSVRQRIQSLGRVLRRQFGDEASKGAEMHLIYVADTVDEIIYAKEDWSDLTGEATNRYWTWPLDPDAPPEQHDAPPQTPRPTEEQEWHRLGQRAPTEPVDWLGAIPDREYSIDTTGTVTTRAGSVVTNPQEVDSWLRRIRERPGGRFYVTPAHRLVVAWGQRDGEPVAFVLGQLSEPLALLDSTEDERPVPDVTTLGPGDAYEGPLDDAGGRYALRQRHGGTIERRRSGREIEWAFEEGAGHPDQERNARETLEAWRSLARPGMAFKVNGAGHAWFLEGGQPRFLARVDGGFVFPSDLETAEVGEGG